MTKTSQDLVRDICEVQGVASAELDQVHPFVHVQLQRDSQTTIDRVRDLLRNPPSGLFPKFTFPNAEEFAHVGQGKDTAEMNTAPTDSEIAVVNDPNADTVILPKMEAIS